MEGGVSIYIYIYIYIYIHTCVCVCVRARVCVCVCVSFGTFLHNALGIPELRGAGFSGLCHRECRASSFMFHSEQKLAAAVVDVRRRASTDGCLLQNFLYNHIYQNTRSFVHYVVVTVTAVGHPV